MSVGRSSSTMSSPMSNSSVSSADQRCFREGHARRQPGWEKQERDRLERLIMEETKRVRRFQGTLDITVRSITGYWPIMGEGKTKVKTLTLTLMVQSRHREEN